jgi:crossover junction endodeoxyribonuclease RuvC
MRILGIDPGSAATGYGLVDRSGPRVAHVAHGTVRLPRGLALPERLALLHAELLRVAATFRPDVAVVERVFAGRSVRAALVLGQARGTALAALAAAGLPVHEVTAQQVKLAVTGCGSAEKAQVQAMVRRLLGLASAPPRDAADALAAAIFRAQAGALTVLPFAVAPRGRRAAASRLVVRRAP